MRILAIRGAQIASLAGEFAVELDRGPLASAGLFAIVGPTGAGKSTLLDALCAALYNRTPRLDGRSSVKIGRDDDPEELHLSPFDVRSLVRRDAVSGWCEVDFEGRDGRRWRARWHARRARGRVTGRLQDVEQSLVCLDTGEVRGGTRTETLAAIEDAVGLSFDQFRRSALLAQGDFAAFLRADVGQRAELLERMTGTEIYGALSIAAHRRAGELAAELDALRGELGRIAALDDDARAAAEAEAVATAAAAAQAAAAQARLDQAVAWQREDAARVAQLAEAEAALVAAGRAADAGAAAAAALVGELGGDGAAAAAGGDAARAGLDALAPVLAAAHVLDGRLDDARGAAARAGRGAATAEAEAAAARAAVTTLADEEARLIEQRADAARWLDGHGHVAAAHAERARVARELAALATARAGVARLGRELARREAARVAAAARLDAARVGLAEAKLVHQDVQSRWEAAEDRARKQPVAAVEARFATLQRERVALDRLAATAAEASRAAAAVDDHAAHAAVRAAAAADAEARAAAGDAGLAVTRAALAEAEGSRDRLRAAAGLAAHRAELVDGEPCPLCGAAEHPWAGQGVVDELVAAQDGRVATLRAEVERGAQALAADRAEARAAADEAARATAAAAAERAALAAARTRWRDGVIALGELLLAEEPVGGGAAAWLEARLHAAEDAQARLDKELKQARKRADDARYLDEQVRLKRNDLEHAEDAVREAEDADRAAAAAVAEAVAERRDHERDAARARAELDAPLAAWPGLLARVDAGDAVADEVAAAVARWDADSRRRADAGERLAELAVRLADGRARLAAAEAAAVTATTTATDAAARAAALADERAALLGGRATAAAAAALDARRAALETLHRSVAGARAVVDERGARLAAHRAAAPPDATAGDDVSAALAAAVAARAAADDRHRRATLALEVDDAARAQRAACAAELARRTDAAEVHRQLAELIGSHDGKKLRTFAQSLSLDGLLAAANHHLIDLAPRYRLERVRGHDLELQIVDRDMGDEVRSVNSLSGGESFLVSLALALGLSSLSARNVRVRTLLIDEGFGTLDPSTLDVALDVLDTLQSSGRQVGIISHVPGLAERVPAQVVVRPTGAGRSTVVVRAAG